MMKKTIVKRITVVLLMVSFVIGMLSACGKTNTDNKEKEAVDNSQGTTIKWISQGVGESGWEGLTKPILEEFEKETGIHVETEFYSFNDLFEVLETKAASKSQDYDVASVDVTYVAKYGSSGYLEPLDDYFTEQDKAQWDESSYSAGVWDGKMYAAPMNTSTQELYYNKTLLDKAGITVPENDENNRLTYEEVADLAKQAQEKLDPDGSQGIIGFDFQQVSRVYQMNMLANSMGGKNISDDGYSIDGVVNTEPWIKAMTWYQNLVNDGVASRGFDPDTLQDQFYSGKVVFMIGGTWTRTNMLNGDELGVTYAPCFKGYEKDVATSTGSWYFGMNSQSKNKEAVAKFINYFTVGKGNDMWLEINGDVPSRLEKQKEIIDNPDAIKDMKIAAYEAANTAVPRAVTPVFGEYSTILNAAWEDVRNGANVEDTLNVAVEKFNSAVANLR